MIKTLSQKLWAAQQKIGAVTKSANNPHFRSKYADLNEVLDVAKEGLNSEGVFISQAPGRDTMGHYVETALIDADSGQQLSGRVYFSGIEDNMQKIGAAITYARRFGLKSLLAMEDEDDDGERAVGRGSSGSSGSNGTSNKVGIQGGTAPNVSPGRATVIHTNTLVYGEAAKAGTPVQAEIPKGAEKEKVLKSITAHSSVVIGKRRKTLEEVKQMVEAFGVKTKEELTSDQAETLLNQLKELANS